MTHRANLSAALLLACCALLSAADTPLTLVGIAPDTGISASDGLTRDGALTVSGVALPGQAVALKAGSTSIGGATTDATGAWTIVLAAPLAAGQHTLTAATGSGLGARTSSLVIRIDTTAPAAPTALVCSPDTGSSASDFITNAEAPAIAGKSEAGAVVRLRLSTAASSVEAATTADAQGAWSVALPPLAEGVWTVEAIVADVAGNEATFAALKTLTIDRSAPPAPTFATLSPDTGIAGDWLTSATAPKVGGAAPDAVSVSLSINGGTAIAAALSNGAWTANLPVQQPGVHQLSAVAIDRAGNASQPGLRQLEIRTQAAAPTLAFAGDTGAVADSITADATLVFSGTAEPGGTIALTIDGAAAGSAAVDALGAWSIDRTQQILADGARSVVAKVTDSAGLTASTTLVVTVDTRGPAAVQDIVLRPEGGQPGDAFTADRRIAISGRAEAGVEVVVIVDDRALAVFPSSPEGFFDIAFGPLAAGPHGVVVHARDAAGNFGPPSPVIAIVVGGSAPEGGLGVTGVVVTGAPTNAPITSGQQLTVSFTGHPQSMLVITDVETGYEAGRFAAWAGSDGNGTVAVPGLPAGTYEAALSDGQQAYGSAHVFVVLAGLQQLPRPVILDVRGIDGSSAPFAPAVPLVATIALGRELDGAEMRVAAMFDGQPHPVLELGQETERTALLVDFATRTAVVEVAAPPTTGGNLVVRVLADVDGDGAFEPAEVLDSLPVQVIVGSSVPAPVISAVASVEPGPVTESSVLLVTGTWNYDPALIPDAELRVSVDAQYRDASVDGVVFLPSLRQAPGNFAYRIAPLPSGLHAVRVVAFSDRDLDGLPEPVAQSAAFPIQIGGLPIEIVRVVSELDPTMPPTVDEPMQLVGRALRAIDGRISVMIDGRLVHSQPLRKEAGQSWAVNFQAPLEPGRHAASVRYESPVTLEDYTTPELQFDLVPAQPAP